MKANKKAIGVKVSDKAFDWLKLSGKRFPAAGNYYQLSDTGN
jgi:hypothetical protein